ncbi:MAG TPA: crotonase/enoyl-CoA hydratase family protein [Acidimicrobiales bacterium]|jgi:enoyl-CoA hydratase/carnithine racemase|nr:crotonase/enoyl-CoA hydratase family protein [Acidimicrobiales bacterium]
MGEADRVTVTVDGGVADVRLNRPDKMNALDIPMFAGLREASQRIAGDPAVRAVVLSGEGRGFCAGLDLEAISGMQDTGERTGGQLGRREDDSIANWAQQAAYNWSVLPVPVIAAIHGVALGGGAQVALAADIRFMAPDARISILEIRWGLVPDMTGTATLPRLVGLDVAKELTWTGRMVEGEEAVRIGLATRVADDPRKEALELAAEIAGRNPHAIRAGKSLLNRSGQVPLAQQLLDESREMADLIGSPNQTEAVMAYFEKRSPRFTDPG